MSSVRRVSRVFAAPDLWNAHFALPANGPADLPELAGQSYYLDYQGVRVVALDVNAFANDDFRESQRSQGPESAGDVAAEGSRHESAALDRRGRSITRCTPS